MMTEILGCRYCLGIALCPLTNLPKISESPKAKKQKKWCKNGQGGDQRRDFKGQGWQTLPSNFLAS